MQKPAIVFLGTSAFAVPCLQVLHASSRVRLSHVITQPDRPVGRKQICTPPPVKDEAMKLELPILQPESLNKSFTQISSSIPQPDYLIVVSYGQILSEEVLAWPSCAAINVHASLLPKLRGASPLQHAILQGMPTSGVTIQQMVRELDAGPILGQASTKIEAQDTATTLHDRLATMGAALLLETLLKPLHAVEQDHAAATFCGKLSRENGIVDPATMTAEEIDRHVRALTPWPGASWKGMKLLQASLENVPNAFPLTCKDKTTLYIQTIQPPSKKPMSGADFMRGYTL